MTLHAITIICMHGLINNSLLHTHTCLQKNKPHFSYQNPKPTQNEHILFVKQSRKFWNCATIKSQTHHDFDTVFYLLLIMNYRQGKKYPHILSLKVLEKKPELHFIWYSYNKITNHSHLWRKIGLLNRIRNQLLIGLATPIAYIL